MEPARSRARSKQDSFAPVPLFLRYSSTASRTTTDLLVFFRRAKAVNWTCISEGIFNEIIFMLSSRIIPTWKNGNAIIREVQENLAALPLYLAKPRLFHD